MEEGFHEGKSSWSYRSHKATCHLPVVSLVLTIQSHLGGSVTSSRRSLDPSYSTCTCQFTKAQLPVRSRFKSSCMTFIYCLSIPYAIFLDKMSVSELYILRKATIKNLMCSKPRQAESGSPAGDLPVVTVSTRRMRSTCGGVGLNHRKRQEVLTECEAGRARAQLRIWNTGGIQEMELASSCKQSEHTQASFLLYVAIP